MDRLVGRPADRLVDTPVGRPADRPVGRRLGRWLGLGATIGADAVDSGMIQLVSEYPREQAGPAARVWMVQLTGRYLATRREAADGTDLRLSC